MQRNIWMVLLLFALLIGCSSTSQADATPRIKSLPPIQITATKPSVTPQASPISITASPTPAAWTVVDGSPSANQIRTLLVDRSGDLWAGGPAGVVHWDLDTHVPTVYTTGVHFEYTNVVALIRASDDAIWAGTFGNGIGIFDGASWQPLNAENGLPGNYVISLTRTGVGEIWADLQKMPYPADAGQEYYFGRFEGNKWINEVGGGFNWVLGSPNSIIVGAYNYPFIGYTFTSDIAFYKGHTWEPVIHFPYEYIDAITVAPDGVIWVATHDHLFQIVGRTLHKFIPPWAAEDFVPAVTSIAVAEDGTAWFGFSHASFLEYPCGSRWEPDQEQGVYRYDGTTWTHFTTEDGLVNNKICAIATDSKGNVWFGSFDKGISRFDGREWQTYAIP